MNLKLYVDSNFEGLNLNDLRSLARKAGIKTPAGAREDWLKAAMTASVNGDPMPDMPERKVAEPKVEPKAESRAMPNLTPNGRWGGRRHKVVVSNNTGDANRKGIVVHWEGVPCSLPFDKVVHVGEPWFNAMRERKTTLHAIKTVTDDEGVKRVDLVENQVPTVSFSYLGVDEDTAHLPGSILEYYQILAKEKSYFAKYTRRALTRILSDLRPEIGADRARQMTDDDLRYEILMFLGPEFADHMLADEEAA